jgi:hypothetical protein
MESPYDLTTFHTSLAGVVWSVFAGQLLVPYDHTTYLECVHGRVCHMSRACDLRKRNRTFVHMREKSFIRNGCKRGRMSHGEPSPAVAAR